MSIPSGASDVSPYTTSTPSIDTPSSSATIWAKVVTWLCPCGVVPAATTTFPVGRTRMEAASHPPAAYIRDFSTREGARPHISRYVENPIPSCLVSPRSRRDCCSLRSSS